MITRLWRAHASHENADAFEDLFRTHILPAILDRRIAGLKKATMLRRDLEGDVKFCALFQFDSIDAVREFAGDDYEVAVVPNAARKLLSSFEPRVAHYRTVASSE